ncbi:MAG TPA: hypothetical protein H9774_07905 [Candidatus Desulfovibrio gallistercoris]|nr:hypothetical protein [Candidatus Desulfovibrio gallistercoris]
MMENYPQPCVDLVLSEEFHIVVLFMQPKSKTWPLVRQYCKKADLFYEQSGYTAACFREFSPRMQYVFAIGDITREWKTALYFIRGRRVENLYILPWLHCYHKAMSCNDYRAYCHTIYSENKPIHHDMHIHICLADEGKIKNAPEIEIAPRRYLIPCRMIRFFPEQYAGHPSTLQDLFQAETVATGYGGCPFLHPEDFTVLA